MWDSREEGLRWLAQAEHDLSVARLTLEAGYFSHCCFLCQQAAEKAVTAIAYALGERIVLGHSVSDLCKRYAARVAEFEPLIPRAGGLDLYYVPTRYPNGLPGGVPHSVFTERQATEAIDSAGRFLSLARVRFGGPRRH